MLYVQSGTGYCLDLLSDPALIARVESRYGPDVADRVAALRRLVISHREAAETSKLDAINRFFNRIPSRSDLEQWGQRDYWATPFELLRQNGGDCEDYAAAKYFTLRLLNVPDDRLRLGYVTALVEEKDRLRLEPHMVLLYYAEAESVPLVLDNLHPEVIPASSRKDLTLSYAHNGEALWRAKKRKSADMSLDAPLNGIWGEM